MSRTDRRRRSKPPSDLRARFLFEDLEALGIAHAADLAYRIALATFQPVADPEGIARALECFQLLNELDIPYVIGGGWVADFQFGRVLRDHDDIDIFVLDEDEAQVLTLLSGSVGMQVLPQSEDKRAQRHYKVRFRNELTIDLAIVAQLGTRGAVWDGAFEFGLEGLEERRRQLTGSSRSISARTFSPELHYLFKLSGLKHFEGAVRDKDLADIRAMLPLLSPQRLAEAKAALIDNAERLATVAPAE